MDDPSVSDQRLERALNELEFVNRWLGGHHASATAFRRLVGSNGPLRVLDVGTGIGDYLHVLQRTGQTLGCAISLVGIDTNPHTIHIARQSLKRHAQNGEASDIDVRVGDALALPFDDDSFDVAHAALLLHHFDDQDAVRALAEMSRVARRGVIINDLHRHPLPYYFLKAVGRLPFVGEMFAHDGPISVLRSFSREELHALAQRAGLTAEIRWHMGFRWYMVASSSEQ